MRTSYHSLFKMCVSLPLLAMGASFPVTEVGSVVVVCVTEGGALSETRPAPVFLKPNRNIVTAQPSPSEINPAFRELPGRLSNQLTGVGVMMMVSDEKDADRDDAW